MKLALGFLALACSIALAQTTPSRPPITGISHIAVYAADPAAAQHYYVDLIGCEKGPDPENPQATRYYVNSTQFIEVLPLRDKSSPNRLDHLAYKTADAEKLRLYLKAKGVEVPSKVEHSRDNEFWFDVKDPEGNTVRFVEWTGKRPALAIGKTTNPNLSHENLVVIPKSPQPVGTHIIHVGMLVHSREKEDAFYRAILDFKPYWYGGMQPDRIDWVSQQTPESHDWLEYMLSGGDMQNVSQKQLGVLNHLSIGVVSVPKAFDTLKAGNRLSSPNDHTQIGKDGKWQLNLFDPDGTRLEYMEFSNVQKPCCSDFTAPNPSPTE
jgi:catechol 2,3-dioxygenase-like lactoylglutathione lyase family enzyme